MAALFSTDDQKVPAIRGLSYLPHYVTADEEEAIATLIDAEAWDTTWERRR